MKFSIATCLWLTFVFAAFMLGVTIRDSNDPLTEVLVANHHIVSDSAVWRSDFRVELRRLSKTPKAALTEKRDIQKNVATTLELQEGDVITASCLQRYPVFENRSWPRNLRLVTLKLGQENHSLVNHLLSEGDNVSIYAIYKSTNKIETVRKLAGNATVVLVSDAYPNAKLVGVLVPIQKSKHIALAFDDPEFVDFKIDEPEIDES